MLLIKGGGMKIRIGARGSRLAMWQARKAENLIKEAFSGADTEVIAIRTKGDEIKEKPLYEIGGTGVFVKEIEKALYGAEISLAVHSLKDMPLELSQGLMIAACLERAYPGDALVSKKYSDLKSIPAGARIGTGSRRRESQLKYMRPHLIAAPLRGNIETRISKALSGDLDAIIIAAAGITRLSLDANIKELLPLDVFTPAPGQGIIALEIREGDKELAAVLKGLDDGETRDCYMVEKAFLKETGGGCFMPVGALCARSGGGFKLSGYIGDRDGRRVYRDSILFNKCDEKYGVELAGALLASGGRRVLDDIREQR